jgi:hypothetical protein
MEKTVTQELRTQIEQLYSQLRVYKKAQVNLTPWMDTKILSIFIEQLKTEIHELEIQLEVLTCHP